MNWYRITLDTSGKVVKCAPVDKAGSDGGGVFYIRAIDAKQAAAKVAAEYNREKVRARRAKYKAAGLCTECGGQPEKTAAGRLKRRCPSCLARNEMHQRRSDARSSGVEVPPLPKGGAAVSQIRAANEISTRLATLHWVRRVFKANTKPGAFEKALELETNRLLALRAPEHLKKGMAAE